MPELESIVIRYADQIVPILPLADGITTKNAIAQGNAFAVNGSNGAIATVGSDRLLHVNGQVMTVSPASAFGLNENLSITDLVWSLDGQRLAFRVDAASPDHDNAIDSGIWIYEPATNRSWQIFRNTYRAEQLHQQRRAVTTQWAPNGSALVVKVETPLGYANVFMPVYHDVNAQIESIIYADATWTTDSAALVVSGTNRDNQTVIGRIALDEHWTYTEYANQLNTGLTMQTAIELEDGRIAFVGSQGNRFALYAIQPAKSAQPVQLSNQTLAGQIIAAEWNAERTAVLVTTLEGHMGVMGIGGQFADIILSAGIPDAAHWQ
jgi:hypothetical protein